MDPFRQKRSSAKGRCTLSVTPDPMGNSPRRMDEPLAERILALGENGEGGRKVFTHGDLHQSNIIVNENVITGVIYWGAVGYSIMAKEYFGLRWQALDLEWRDLVSTIAKADEYDFWTEVNQSTLDYTGF